MKRPLRVTMYVSEPSDVELQIQETVRIDRMTISDAGEFDTERHGALLRPGMTRLQLDPGMYHFRTMADAALRVVRGGVTAVAAPDRGKDPPVPPPPPKGLPVDVFGVGGDDPPGNAPELTVVYG